MLLKSVAIRTFRKNSKANNSYLHENLHTFQKREYRTPVTNINLNNNVPIRDRSNERKSWSTHSRETYSKHSSVEQTLSHFTRWYKLVQIIMLSPGWPKNSDIFPANTKIIFSKLFGAKLEVYTMNAGTWGGGSFPRGMKLIAHF